MSDKGQELARATARLSALKTDFAAWHAGALLLAKSGEKDAATTAFDELGAAANRYGMVALALSCAQRIVDFGSKQRAKELVAAIAKLHCKGSKFIDESLGKKPHSPPPGRRPDVEDIDLKSATKSFLAASAVAAKDSKSAAPKKLAATPLVSVLEADDFRKLCEVVKLREFPAGKTVVDVGDNATSLFWVARGELLVERDDHELGVLLPGAIFGEIALVGATTRTARVKSKGPSVVLEFPAEAIESAAIAAPTLARVLASYARSRLLGNVMRTSELFTRLSDEERGRLLLRFKSGIVDAGDFVTKKGEDNDSLYVVASGRLEVRDGQQVLAELSIGDGIGEMSLLSRKPAVADVVTVERSVLLSLSRDEFDDIAVAHPSLLAEVYKLLVEREQENEALVHDAADLIV